ncbi:enoyl-CoA hydratase/isomerase family protein [Bacillus sp. DNRA2]|uniref:enoyl-CoA hydratase/isomerase family protein n=1 Tax=Bacillus sp. DNRA2 TaxID=2723053 RepID=UPI00145DADDC|nr:enoyl-CoA hydratase/isomerase family protein [Bacillus sp. DNRA2]NMD71158.1 enoyl-CoA hydratase/isomerase family protein [Bacillus sp. DNRA2]
MSSPVIYRVDGQIGHIILNRPEKENSLTEDLVVRVVEALRVAEEDPDIKVIILSGEGQNFCGGANLDVLMALENASETSKWIEMTASLAKTIVDLDKYVVAAVQGFATGAGFGLALASDFIIADRTAKFSLSFSRLGLIPDMGLTKNLVDYLPLALAKEWISSGRIITVEEAYQKGIVNQIVEGNLYEHAVAFSQFIMDGPPLSNKYVKHLLNRARYSNLDVALMNENMVQTVLLQTQDHKEAVRAFLENRTPKFSGN